MAVTRYAQQETGGSDLRSRDAERYYSTHPYRTIEPALEEHHRRLDVAFEDLDELLRGVFVLPRRVWCEELSGLNLLSRCR